MNNRKLYTFEVRAFCALFLSQLNFKFIAKKSKAKNSITACSLNKNNVTEHRKLHNLCNYYTMKIDTRL